VNNEERFRVLPIGECRAGSLRSLKLKKMKSPEIFDFRAFLLRKDPVFISHTGLIATFLKRLVLFFLLEFREQFVSDRYVHVNWIETEGDGFEVVLEDVSETP